jgi:hypothetical protein
VIEARFEVMGYGPGWQLNRVACGQREETRLDDQTF